jgi:hypothetical protein
MLADLGHRRRRGDEWRRGDAGGSNQDNAGIIWHWSNAFILKTVIVSGRFSKGIGRPIVLHSIVGGSSESSEWTVRFEKYLISFIYL